MDPNQYNPQPDPYTTPYSPAPQPARPVPNPDMYQPPQPYGTPTNQNPYAAPQPQQPQPQYGPPQPSYGTAQPQSQPNSNPYATPVTQPGMTQQGPIQQVQSPMMGYNPYPYPEEFTPRKRGPNKLLFGIITVVVIVGATFGVLALQNKDNNNGDTPNDQTPTNTTNNNASKDVIPRTDGKLDLSSKITTSKTLKQQSIQGNMKEQVNLSSGFSFMATTVADYAPTSSSTVAATGKRFIVITVVAGNRADSGNLSVSYLDFRLRGEGDSLIAGNAATNEITGNALSSPAELKSGEQLTGKIVFEVGDKESTWVLQHTETYQKTTDNTTFEVRGEIGLVLTHTTSTDTTTQTTDTTTQ